MDWHYIQPVDIHFGNGMLSCLGEQIQKIGGKRGILVTSSSFMENGLVKRLLEENPKTICTVYSGVSPNTDISECDACADMIRKEKCDFVIALGGGSVIDCAKAAAAFCLDTLPTGLYFEGKVALPVRKLPLIAIPTTAGTGSEVTRVTVLMDHAQGIKAPLKAPVFYPTIAIVDPELTYTLPKYITACTGMDALCHAIEAYWNTNHHPISDAFAFHAANLAVRYLEQACFEPDSAIAREKMAEASLTAGMAFTLTGTTSVHACSYPLGALLDMPHGEACGLTIDRFMKINAESDSDGRLKRLARAMGYPDVESVADAITELKFRIGLKNDLIQFNLTDGQIEQLVHGSQHPNLKNNPVPITEDTLRSVYRSMVI